MPLRKLSRKKERQGELALKTEAGMTAMTAKDPYLAMKN